MDNLNCPYGYSITCGPLSKAKYELEKKLDEEKARHRSVVLELENVIVDLMVENYRYESRVKALERLLEEYEKNQPAITREEATDGE
jgi:translation initiation factor IF-3